MALSSISGAGGIADISSISGVSASAPVSASSGSGADEQISALRQQLQKLQVQKRKAKKNNDTETVKKLEAQIKAVRRQIQRLMAQKTKQKAEAAKAGDGEQQLAEPGLGKYVDERV